MNDRQAAGGIGFVGALALLFIGLKLGGVLSWSWWWVLAPIWIPVLLALVILAVCAVLWILFGRREERERRERGRPAPFEHGPSRRWGRRG